MRSLGWTPIQRDWCPYKNGSRDISCACVRRKDLVRTWKAAISGPYERPQKKNLRHLSSSPQNCGKSERLSFTPPQPPPQSVVLCYGSPSRLIAIFENSARLAQFSYSSHSGCVICLRSHAPKPMLFLPSHTVLCSSQCFTYRKAP